MSSKHVFIEHYLGSSVHLIDVHKTFTLFSHDNIGFTLLHSVQSIDIKINLIFINVNKELLKLFSC